MKRGDRMKLEERVAEFIRENKISQKELSRKTGITENAISMMMNKKRRLLADEYIRICKSLCLPYDRFADDQKSA